MIMAEALMLASRRGRVDVTTGGSMITGVLFVRFDLILVFRLPL
jgi:hypothetical protein